MGIDMVPVMDALRALAIEKKAAIPKGNVPLFNSAFLKTVHMFGRTYDLGLLALYKIGTSSYFQDADKIPLLLGKKKIALLPSFSRNRKTIRRIFEIARQHRADARTGHTDTNRHIGRTTHDSQRFGFAHVHLAHIQAIRIRMFCHRQDFGNHYAVKGRSKLRQILDFEAGHSQHMAQCFASQRRIDPAS